MDSIKGKEYEGQIAKCTDKTHRAMYYKGYREGFRWALVLALSLLEGLWGEVSDEDKSKVQKVIDSLGM